MIPHHPHAVWWLLNGMHYQLMEVRPQEFDRIAHGLEDIIGTPKIYTLIDDDVKWWPQSFEGEPVVVVGDPMMWEDPRFL